MKHKKLFCFVLVLMMCLWPVQTAQAAGKGHEKVQTGKQKEQKEKKKHQAVVKGPKPIAQEKGVHKKPSVIVKPGPAKPEITKPEITKPTDIKPTGTKPVVTKPAGTPNTTPVITITPTPTTAPVPPVTEMGDASDKLRQEVVSYALQFVGIPYVWGETSLTEGVDCSGFVRAIYAEFGYSLPRVSRNQAKSAGYMDVIPDEEHLLPGDLIFYTNNSGVVSHVALYIGDGQIVHAANSDQGVIISDYTDCTELYKARRVIE